MWSDARKRARKKNIPFNINKNDIIIPEICPILNIPLVFGDKIIHDASPTLDRIDPSRGYIPGNIQVISNKANRIKTNASIAEIELVFEWFKRNQIL